MYKSRSAFLSVVISLTLCACASTQGKSNYDKLTLENLLEHSDPKSKDRALLSTSSLQRAQSDLDAGAVKSALKYANLAVQFDPADANAQSMLGKAEIANMNYDAGAAIFEKIVTTDASAENYQFLGISRYYLKQDEAAKAAFLQASKLDDTLWRSSVLLARIEARNGNSQKAEMLFKHSLSQSQSPEVVYEHMGQAYAESNNWEQALAAFRNAQLLSGDSVGVHDQYRLAMAKRGQLGAVLQTAKSDEVGRLYRSLGEDALHNSDKSKAVEYFKKALASFSRHDEETSQLLQSAINLPG